MSSPLHRAWNLGLRWQFDISRLISLLWIETANENFISPILTSRYWCQLNSHAYCNIKIYTHYWIFSVRPGMGLQYIYTSMEISLDLFSILAESRVLGSRSHCRFCTVMVTGNSDQVSSKSYRGSNLCLKRNKRRGSIKSHLRLHEGMGNIHFEYKLRFFYKKGKQIT